jgi:hypothetical protein
VFIEAVVQGSTPTLKKQFSKEYHDVRKRFQGDMCPFYNGGEKRIMDTEFNVNPYFEKVATRLLKQPVYDIEDLN